MHIHVAGSVLSSTKTFLDLYRDPTVAKNRSRSDFRIRDLMHYADPVSLYIITQPNEMPVGALQQHKRRLSKSRHDPSLLRLPAPIRQPLATGPFKEGVYGIEDDQALVVRWAPSSRFASESNCSSRIWFLPLRGGQIPFPKTMRMFWAVPQ